VKEVCLHRITRSACSPPHRQTSRHFHEIPWLKRHSQQSIYFVSLEERKNQKGCHTDFNNRQTYMLQRLRCHFHDRSRSLSYHPTGNSDRFDDAYSPTPGRTVIAQLLDGREIDSVSIYQRQARIVSGWQAPRPHSRSINKL
jgi:hypothetical protein